MHAALEKGEFLYPQTAAEGRDIVRHELRQLRERWESLGDSLSDTQRSLEVSSLQLSSYEENFGQFNNWLKESQSNLQSEAELKATLPEKKIQLQNHKVCLLALSLLEYNRIITINKIINI